MATNWLKRQFDAIEEEVKYWPEWKLGEQEDKGTPDFEEKELPSNKQGETS